MRDRIIKLSEMNFEKLNVITLTESGGLMGEIVVIKKGHKPVGGIKKPPEN